MSKKNIKMNEKNCIWKDEENLMFINAIDPNIEECLLFELLYIGDLRVGEVLALTPMDFNFKENTLTINKSLTYINDKAVSTSTKQLNDNRTIRLPNKLLNEMENFINNNQIKNTNNVFRSLKDELVRFVNIYGTPIQDDDEEMMIWILEMILAMRTKEKSKVLPLNK